MIRNSFYFGLIISSVFLGGQEAFCAKKTALADKDWQTFKFNKNIIKGSCLDFSSMNHLPAGKFGEVIVNQYGETVFKKTPHKTIRFYGANICFHGVYMGKEECEKLAQRMRRIGYNAARLHHYDHLLTKKIDEKLRLIPSQINKMDYLFKALKQNGIYVAIDLFSIRQIEYKGKLLKAKEAKICAAFSDEVLKKVLEAGVLLLNHKNIYTKLKWKDDPALFMVNIINENSLLAYLRSFKKKSPEIKKLIMDKFKEYLISIGKSSTKADFDSPLFTVFMSDAQEKLYIKSAKILKDMGVKSLLTDMSHRTFPFQTVARNRFDSVDIHRYIDHPRFLKNNYWTWPYVFTNRSATEDMVRDFALIASGRVFNKPFFVTEFNMPYPNRYRAECGPIMASLASLQGWDGIFRFNYLSFNYKRTGNPLMKETNRSGAFDIVADPGVILSEKIGILLYRNKLVDKAKKRIAFAVTPNCASTERANLWRNWHKRFEGMYPKEFWSLAFYCQIGSIMVNPEKKEHKLPFKALITDEYNELKALANTPLFKVKLGLEKELEKANIIDGKLYTPLEGKIESENHQLQVSNKPNAYKVITSKAEYLSVHGVKAKAKNLSVTSNSQFAAIFATSLDHKKLVESKHVLVMHIVDVRNVETIYEKNEKSFHVYDWGGSQLLVRKAFAKLSLKNKNKTLPTLWALDFSGQRLYKLKVDKGVSNISFWVSTDRKTHTVMAYELIWK